MSVRYRTEQRRVIIRYLTTEKDGDMPLVLSGLRCPRVSVHTIYACGTCRCSCVCLCCCDNLVGKLRYVKLINIKSKYSVLLLCIYNYVFWENIRTFAPRNGL